jgi:hypothetical protein
MPRSSENIERRDAKCVHVRYVEKSRWRVYVSEVEGRCRMSVITGRVMGIGCERVEEHDENGRREDVEVSTFDENDEGAEIRVEHVEAALLILRLLLLLLGEETNAILKQNDSKRRSPLVDASQ